MKFQSSIAFVKFRSAISFVIALFFCGITYSQNCNLLLNGNFNDGRDAWEKYQALGGKAIFQADSGLFSIQILETANQAYGVQASQGEMVFEQNETYFISFRAKSNNKNKITVALSKNGSPYTSFLSQNFITDSSWTIYTIKYPHTLETEENSRIELNVGSDTGEIFFDDIIIQSESCFSGKKKPVRSTKGQELYSNWLEKHKVKAKELPKVIFKEAYLPLTVSGYVRFSGIYRNLNQNSPLEVINSKAFLVNGVFVDSPLGNGITTGYREPLLMLQFNGKPSANSDFGVDFLFDNQLTGELLDSSRRLQIYRFINLNSSVSTSFGKFSAKFGGINFVNISPLTLWRYQIRDDMFERYPWEWSYNSFGRYTEFYDKNTIAKDSRIGSVSFQGAIFEATGLPKRFGLSLFFGKSDGSRNGFNSFLVNNYRAIISSRVYKGIGKQNFGINTYYQFGFLNDYLPKGNINNELKEKVFTADARLRLGQASVNVEGGLCSFTNPDKIKEEFEPVFMANALIPKTILGLGLKLNLYAVGTNFLNGNSVAANSINYGDGEYGVARQYNSNQFRGIITEIGQLASNRQGSSVIFNKDLEDLKVSLGAAWSSEIKQEHNFITFQNYTAGLNRSQLVFYQAEIGPYKRVINTWRRSFEEVVITDSIYNGKKYFTTLDLSLKYKIGNGKHAVILSNYTNYNSVGDAYTFIPKFDNTAFIRTFFNETMAFIKASDKVTFVTQIGYGINKGNNRINTADSLGNQFSVLVTNEITKLDELKPIYNSKGLTLNQLTYSFGLGVDIDITEQSGFYIRQKWYDHKDNNFKYDKFRGWETSIEFKTRF